MLADKKDMKLLYALLPILLLANCASVPTPVSEYEATVQEELAQVDYQTFDPKVVEIIAPCRDLRKESKARFECFEKAFFEATSSVERVYKYTDHAYVRNYYETYGNLYAPQISTFIEDIIAKEGDNAAIDKDVLEFLARVHLYETLTRECHTQVKAAHLAKRDKPGYDEMKEKMDALNMSKQFNRSTASIEEIQPYCKID